MTGEGSGGDESYDQALQRTMHAVLPSILAEIADLRPTDPIDYLALCLHKTREREDIQEANTPQNNQQQDSGRVTNIQPSGHLVTQHTWEIKQPVILKELTDSELKSETDTKLHVEVSTLFRQIGDLFDEADIS